MSLNINRRKSFAQVALPVDEEEFHSFEFDVLSLSAEELYPAVRYMFEQGGLLNEVGLTTEVLATWVFKLLPEPLGP